MADFKCPEDTLGVANALVDPAINLDALFDRCPDTCRLAWVTNNPDLSGVGVCISYLIQAALVLLFQFPFVAFYYLSSSSRRRILAGVFERFFKTYATFNVAFLLAALIVHARSSGIIFGYELVFLLYLLQFIAVGICAVTATPLVIRLLEILVVGAKPDEFRWRFSSKKIMVFSIVYLLNFGSAAYMTLRPADQRGFEAAYGVLAPRCSQFAGVAPPQRWMDWIWLAASLVMLLSILPVRVLSSWARSGGSRRRLVSRSVILTWLVLLVAVGLAMSAMLGYLVYRLADVRRRLGQVIEMSMDNDWGFGQLLALFVWVDPVVETGQKVGRFAWHRLGPRSVREKSRLKRSRMEEQDQAQEQEYWHNDNDHDSDNYPHYQPDVELTQQQHSGWQPVGGMLTTPAVAWGTTGYSDVAEGKGAQEDQHKAQGQSHPMYGSWR
ncbi:glycosyltransferase 2 family protein [Microdochium nivale]|nr:glycosyltransferase 2 family protein [Microdochium nivale]